MGELDDINSLAFDLGRGAAAALTAARAVVQKGALNIKRDAQAFSSGLAHAPLYPQSITYDTEILATSVRAEIGPDKGKPQGALGNILEYGTSNNPPFAHLGPALDREGPAFERYLGDIAKGLLA